MSRRSRSQAARARQRAANQAAQQRQQSLERRATISPRDFARASEALVRANAPQPHRVIASDENTIIVPSTGETMALDFATKPAPAPPKPNPHEDQYPVKDWIYAGMLGQRITYRELHCCGVKELHGLQGHHQYKHRTGFQTAVVPVSVEDFLSKALSFITGMDRHRPFWIYTVAGDPKKADIGDRLKTVIEKNGLGTVTVSIPALNYNSGNLVRVYLWTVPEGVYEKQPKEIDYAVAA